MASATILSVNDDGFFHTAVVRVTEADGTSDYRVELASTILALLAPAQRLEFLRLTVKAQRDRRIATTPAATPVPIGGDIEV